MARKKQAAVKAACGHKRRRKQLARARKCRKIESGAREETEISQESSSQIDDPQPSTSVSGMCTLLGEKTRSQFKFDSYNAEICDNETVVSGSVCESGQAPICDPGKGGKNCERAIVDIAELDELISGICCRQCKTVCLSELMKKNQKDWQYTPRYIAATVKKMVVVIFWPAGVVGRKVLFS